MTTVLDGIRVLDFGRFIAGPFCATLLADLGADVIRIEKVDGSEDRFNVPVSEQGDGAGFLQMARNKRGMTLNPTKPAGREIVQKLVATADVVVANLPAPTLLSMGLDYDSLKAIKPDIILSTVSAFGSEGPYAEKVGFDTVAQAMSGNLHMGGFPDQPVKAFVPYCDFGTAALTAFGTLAAILHRKQTGEGQIVEGTLLRTAYTMSNGTLIEQALLQLNREGTGNRAQTAAPTDAFKTRDGWIMVQVVGNPLFARWAKLMGEEHWLTDPRFATDKARGDHGHIVSERMQTWCSERTNAECLAELAEARIPCGEVLNPQQAIDNEHVRAIGLLQDVDYPGLPKPAPIVESSVRLSKTPGKIRHRAPTLGEHTDSIMRELGYDDAAIAELREQRII